MTNREEYAAHATGVEASGASVPAAHASTPASATCANCGAVVAGHYCAECGQRVEHAVHSVWHFAREVAEDLTHADSRLWRTLTALLFKPGYLTREFLAGRRVSYLPPLRLYLVLSLFFFVLTTFGGHNGIRIIAVTGPRLEEIDPSQGQRAAQACDKLRYDSPWQSSMEPALRASCRRAVADNGRALREAFVHDLPRAIFVTVPILALVVKPLFWRPRRYYIEHLLFLLHDHAFVFAALGLLSIVAAILPVHALVELLGGSVVCYIPCYYYLALRRVYGQSPWRTLGKLTVLLLAYLVVAGVVLIATSLYAVLAP
jgi:hypothetical protein